MTRLICCLSFAALTLAACEPVPGGLINLPEEVQQLAAPYQDLSSARLNPEDGCYEYLHRGVVEDTYLPLRTAQGNPICTPREA